LRDDAGNMPFSFLSKTGQIGSILFKSSNCAGQRLCLNASSCSSSQDWTHLAVCMGEWSRWKIGWFLGLFSHVPVFAWPAAYRTGDSTTWNFNNIAGSNRPVERPRSLWLRTQRPSSRLWTVICNVS
jgi:hypothetical protein